MKTFSGLYNLSLFRRLFEWQTQQLCIFRGLDDVDHLAPRARKGFHPKLHQSGPRLHVQEQGSGDVMLIVGLIKEHVLEHVLDRLRMFSASR